MFLPGKFHGQRSLAGYGPWGCKRVGSNWVTEHIHLEKQPVFVLLSTHTCSISADCYYLHVCVWNKRLRGRELSQQVWTLCGLMSFWPKEEQGGQGTAEKPSQSPFAVGWDVPPGEEGAPAYAEPHSIPHSLVWVLLTSHLQAEGKWGLFHSLSLSLGFFIGKCYRPNYVPAKTQFWSPNSKMVGWHHWPNEGEFEQTPGGGEGQRSLACCSLWGRKDSDKTEWLNNKQQPPVS